MSDVPGGGSTRGLENPLIKAKLDKLYGIWEGSEKQMDAWGKEVGVKVEKKQICSSCFAREDMPHRPKCKISPPKPEDYEKIRSQRKQKVMAGEVAPVVMAGTKKKVANVSSPTKQKPKRKPVKKRSSGVKWKSWETKL